MTTGLSKDTYETVVFEHDFQRDTLLKALDIVKKFIIFNKRILVGGTAIDYALRTVGSKLYDENKIPDCDFVSPVFHIDAYTLGEQLCDSGITGVSVIRAFHVSTMKVRVNFVEVADIGYVPQNIYDKIPTMESNGFVLVHPNYQMIDQHLALSYPFDLAPRETFFHRWKKDMTRNSLLNEHFPMKHDAESMEILIDSTELPIDLLDGQCITHYPALGFWLDYAKKLGFKTKHKYSFTLDKQKITLTTARDKPIAILTDDFITMLKHKYFDSANIKYFSATLDKIPRYISTEMPNISNVLEIYDNRGRMSSAYQIPKTNIYVSNLQVVMKNLLTKALLDKDDVARESYLLTADILNFACERYVDKPNESLLPLLPYVGTYGEFNWAEPIQLSKEEIISKINHSVLEKNVPRNGYPTATKKIKPELYAFDPTKSDMYQFDSSECEKFQQRTDVHI